MKYAVIICTLLFFNKTAFTQNTDSVQDVLLWQISGNGMPAPSYLYGTFHFLCKDDINISPIAKTKLKECKQIFLEIVPVKKGDPAKFNFLNSTTLDKLIGRKYFQKLSRLVRKSNTPDSVLNRYKPYIASELLDYYLFDCVMTSVEKVLIKLAEKDSLPIRGLETHEEHIIPVDKISLKKQAKGLRYQLNNLDEYIDHIKELIQLYKNGNILKLYNPYQYNPNGSISVSKSAVDFVYIRNELWIPRMENSFLQQPTFFAFGAGHLIGEKGIISLLIKKGYTVKEMYYKR